MDYEKKYKEALERVKKLLSRCRDNRDRRTMVYRVEDIESIFPELKEREDEEMKESCKFFLNLQKINSLYSISDIDKCIAWLEKQGEQNLIKV